MLRYELLRGSWAVISEPSLAPAPGSGAPPDLLAAALAYAARGWRVFPCDPRAEKPFSKRPLVTADRDAEGRPIEGTGWPKKATTDEATIRAWWRRWPNAMIGMAPGWAGAFVVDLDPKGESVEAVEARLAEALGHALPDGPRTVTQSGGRHVWFARPEGAHFGNATTGLKNIDIRCDAGYVILPPSRLANGNAYSWEGEPFTGAAPALPAGLLDLIASRRQRAAGAEPAPPAVAGPAPALTSHAPGEEAKRRYARAALDRIVAEAAGAPQGHRGTELFTAACQLGRFLAAGAISEREALAALADAADANGLTRDDGAARVQREIRRGLEAGRGDASDVVARLETIAREAGERRRREWAPEPAGYPEPRGEARHAPIEHAAPQPRMDGPEEGEAVDFGEMEDEDGPSEARNGGPPAGAVDTDQIRGCADFDHSDTDNAKRFIAHFGADLVVLETEGVVNTDYFVWDGRVWDIAGGNDAAVRLAKKVGGLIALEADHLTWTPQERRDIDDGEQALRDLHKLDKRKADWTDLDKARAQQLQMAIDAGADARAALDKRKVARRKFGISSKNLPRINAMKTLAACDLTRKPAVFDADPYKVATQTHTLRFTRELDPECPDPEAKRFRCTLEPAAGHARADLITKLLPVDFDPEAKCPRFQAFMNRFLPKDAVRRFVQVAAGLGLLGVPVQRIIFHYGNGANGKSVFLETIVRVLGALAASLPTEAIIGTGERQGGQASPELARLFNVRFVRVLELPADEPLKEAVVKKLTGGESIPVRNLFKGYFDFQPVFIAHMSGNGYPKITGTDNGIWRRMAVIHWPVTLGDDEQHDFEEVVGELVAEGRGILNWLIEGARIYLTEGLVTPPEVKAATKEYRDEMDKIGPFIDACVREAPGQHVRARTMYEAYYSWADQNGDKPVFETRFGREAKKRLEHGEIGNLKAYLNCELHSVPPRREVAPRNPGGSSGGANATLPDDAYPPPDFDR